MVVQDKDQTLVCLSPFLDLSLSFLSLLRLIGNSTIFTLFAVSQVVGEHSKELKFFKQTFWTFLIPWNFNIFTLLTLIIPIFAFVLNGAISLLENSRFIIKENSKGAVGHSESHPVL